jgi:hypothetical protein
MDDLRSDHDIIDHMGKVKETHLTFLLLQHMNSRRKGNKPSVQMFAASLLKEYLERLKKRTAE